MSKLLVFLLCLLQSLLFGQVTKKVTVESKNKSYKEVYYVLKSKKSIRQGNYQKMGYKNDLLINGFYKNGLKDSIWTEYLHGGINKKSEGKYAADKKVGVWNYYDSKGDVEQKYDYTKNELVYFKFNDQDKKREFRQINGTDTIYTKLDRPPLYIGGVFTMLEYIKHNIQYPKQARDIDISGKVLITFTIDTNGKAVNHRVTKGIGYGCDEEALRVVKEIPDNWLPGLLNGQAVNIEYVLPINFTLN